MTNILQDVKTAANDFEVKQVSWIKPHSLALILGLVAGAVLGFLVGHYL